MSMLARSVGCSVFVTLCFGALAAQAAEPRPGLWKITSVSERNGVKVGERSLDSCITADAAKSLTQIQFDDKVDPRNECRKLDEQRVGSSLTWRVRCTGAVPVETKALFVFDSPEHYSAELTTTLTVVRTTLESTLKIEGRRVGECQR